MNWGDGLYGGMFFAGMYSAAFFETDPRRVVERGLASIPAASGYALVIRDVLAWSAGHPDDWTATWRLLEEKWDKDDPCPDGALEPFNIDARLNGAYVALGLLYGKGDFARTLEVSTRAGQDSDCNPSSAAGILGVILGYDKIPEAWKAGIPALADTRFAYTRYSFNEIVASTLARALKVIEGAGGRVAGSGDRCPSPGAPRLPPSSNGIRAGRRSGSSTTIPSGPGREPGRTDCSSTRGATAASSGQVAPATKRASPSTAPESRSSDSVSRRADGPTSTSMAPGPTASTPGFRSGRTTTTTGTSRDCFRDGTRVRLVVRADADPRSKGHEVQIERAIVYAPR